VDQILWPYSAATATIKVSLIRIDEDNEATVVWSAARNDTKLVAGAQVEVPDNVNTANTYVVSSEVHMPYTPGIGYVLSGTFDLWDQFYLRPRQGASISCPSC
jgi:hypothetical protein